MGTRPVTEYGSLIDSTSCLSDAAELRARAEQDGYLFFRRLLSPQKIADLRAQVVDLLVRHDLIDVSAGVGNETVVHSAVEAQPRNRVIEQCITVDLYAQVQKLEALHALPHDPALLALFKTLFGEEPFPHPRNIARIALPTRSVLPTPPHQDFPLIQGTEDTWTCWIPLGDTPQALGPLAVSPGSHKTGLLKTKRMPGTGGVGVEPTYFPNGWATASFTAGDVLTFHSLTVHRSLPNVSNNLIRLSVDARFQAATKPIQVMSLLPHYARTTDMPGWDELYAGWKGMAPRYYWRKYDLKFTNYDLRLFSHYDTETVDQVTGVVGVDLDNRSGI